ncbi:MAG: type II secretion system F family protein [Lentisphaerae bacterium]|nr:type II secretion system F family protein [Lentisphaerota bacterium]
MPIYQYSAMDSSGKEKRGTHEAANEAELTAILKDQGMFPTSIKLARSVKLAKKAAPAGGDAKKKTEKKDSKMNINIQLGPLRIKPKQLTVITRQLAILLNAGLPLIRALRTLERQSADPAIKKILGEVATAVEGGATFSEALSQHPNSFDKLFLNMVRAGEASGKLELILDRLAMFMEKAARIAGKVKSAMVYPIVVLSIAGLIGAGLMIFIVPKFEKIFAELLNGKPLPEITQAVLAVSKFMQNHIFIMIGGIVAIVIGFKLAVKTKHGKYAWNYFCYHVPLFGPIVSRSAISRFSRTLGTLMGSGVPVLQSLNIVKETSGNQLVADAIQVVHDAVKEGEPMAPPLDSTKVFPAMVISMIEVGEETGRLPEMLETVADTYDEEVDNAVGALTSMIEPLMIVGLAVIVGGIVIALFAPLISIIENLGG